MIIDIVKLKSGMINEVNIDSELKVDEDLLKKSGIIELKNTKVSGRIIGSDTDKFFLDARVKGTMVLPCSISLKPTNYDFDIKIEENIAQILEEIQENDRILENSIDILPIIWENILMEIPIRVVNEDISGATLEGEGWKFVTEDVEYINPEFEKLKDLLK